MSGQSCVQGNTCQEVEECEGPGVCQYSCSRYQLECLSGVWTVKPLPKAPSKNLPKECIGDLGDPDAGVDAATD
jgi:hypothetical protein